MLLSDFSALIQLQKEIYEEISTVIQIYPLYYCTKERQGTRALLLFVLSQLLLLWLDIFYPVPDIFVFTLWYFWLFLKSMVGIFYILTSSLTPQTSFINSKIVSMVPGIFYTRKYSDIFLLAICLYVLTQISVAKVILHFLSKLSNLFSALSSSAFAFYLCAKGTFSVSVVLLAFLFQSPFWHIVFCAI